MFRTHSSLSRVVGRSSAIFVNRSQTRFVSAKPSKDSSRKKGAKSTWTREKLQTSNQFPLTKALNAVIRPTTETEARVKSSARKTVPDTPSNHVRTQVVSPALCDDVIKYIASTLRKHKGCDILDINPGAGLWSQKIHDYLKPRSHVLLEPRYDKFKRFLDPLLTAPKSKYKLVEKDPLDLDTYRVMVSGGVFPHQVVRDPQDIKAQEANNTLLVIGSLVWDPRLPGLGFDSMAKQLFHHFASAAGPNDLFHAFGLVRTLLWVQHEDFGPMVADSISGMYKANRFLELTHNIELVVNAARTERKIGRGSSGREPQYEIESLIGTLKRARTGGFKIPKHRRAGTYDYATEIERLTDGTGNMRVEAMQEYLRKQHLAGKPTTGLLAASYSDSYNEELEVRKKWPDLDLPMLIHGKGQGGRILQRLLVDHPGYETVKALLRKRVIVRSATQTKINVEACADIHDTMYNLEVKALRMEDGPKKDALMKEIEEQDRLWHETFTSISPNHRSAVINEADERISMRTPPHPRIQWDQRRLEPLLMRPDEVWPQNRLSLVSAEPVPKPIMEDIPDYTEWLHDFVFGLFGTPSEPINEALDKMQHGMSNLIKECPSFKDPEKGGRVLMKHFRVRMLTVDMIKELVTAYRNWPFKEPGSDHPKYFRHKGNVGHYSSRGT
ncbi:S-adenosyl-L-methionine-dependent methyltransferase [Plenodomus tracheiphilus IPT5]|uniref:rRNA adenine N(6)-methyltransferase n=1 Tax=Plenodomus tracheiphilus IPT5 TaxID=1408161 RepID=A0A6A7B1M0_9PLEO|nr:S-adenosyl-L-methionine-dependent methyltransferase [Plenodomus tracheiphilus IPT5]